jgi:hypothetical protein
MFSVSQCPWLFKASCKTFVRLCCRYNIFSVGTGDWDCHQNIARQVAVSGSHHSEALCMHQQQTTTALGYQAK